MNQMQVRLRQVGPTTSEASIRTHTVLVDRPVEKGGSDAGPMGGDLFLSSVGGCFMSNLLAAIRARELEISNVSTDVTGVVSGTPAVFSSIELHVSAEGADPQTLAKLIEIADRGCIMMNTLRGKIEIQIRSGVAA
jgi:putative redox protein